MPVFRSDAVPPPWCELEHFDVLELPAGATHSFGRVGAKEKLIVCEGECRIACGGRTTDARRGANLDLAAPDDHFAVTAVFADATLVRMAGRWGEETGGSGLFGEIKPAESASRGDPVAYPKETAFDCHYHDCDEYWIITAGRGVAVSEGKSYEIGPGDCVATGMGHHHDIPVVREPIEAVYFETTMEGGKRRGHLWEHTHGAAEPRAERA